MIAALLCACGLPSGFLLVGRLRTCTHAPSVPAPSLSIIIPARNEERNLARLLTSLGASLLQPAEVLVVDDESTDNTAAIARSCGAALLPSQPLPAGWNGKTWACHQGAQHAAGELLLFLDADTWFVPGGLDRLIACWAGTNDPAFVLSLLPWHEMASPCEQLSLFFNILMASAGFAAFAPPRLFGQSLLLTRRLYAASGGHASVRGLVLENLGFAGSLRASGARLRCLSGAGTLHMRMFPEGFRQMSSSWIKGFAQGAAHSESLVLAASVLWISALWSAAVLLLGRFHDGSLALLAAWLLLAAQLAWIGRRLGNFHPIIALLYPAPLLYFCSLFGLSLARRAFRRKTMWRGRNV